MLFADKDGNILHPEQVDELAPFEIDERGIYVYSDLFN